MPRYKCTNPECPQCGVEVIVASIKYRYDSKKGEMVPFEPLLCKDCKSELEYTREEGPVNVTIGKFASLSSDEKRAAVHKRSQDHFQKTDKGDLANYKKTITNNLRKQALGQ